MARKKPIKTVADLAVFLRKRRKSTARKFRNASKSIVSVQRAGQRFAAAIAPRPGANSLTLLRNTPDLDVLTIEEFEKIKSSRRKLSQRQNAQRSSKPVHAIGPKIPHNVPHAVAIWLPRTVVGFAGDFLRTRLKKGRASMKILWRELLIAFQSIDPSARFCGAGRAEFIQLTINGRQERFSWSSFERVMRAVKLPAATLGQLAKL